MTDSKEDKRKFFHLFMGLSVVLFLVINRVIGIVAILCLFFWGVPNYIYARKRRVPAGLQRIMSILEREGRRGEGSLMYVLGCLFTALIFTNEYSIPAIFVLAFSDAVASMVGKNYNRNRRTLQGSTAFFLSTVLVLNFFFSPLKSLLASFLVTLVEFYSKEDNIFVPLSAALLTYVLPV